MSKQNFLANNLSRIKASPTIAITSRVIELKNLGKKIISLGAGEPDFDTPEHIKEAAIKAMQAGQTKYTPVSGTKELKDAIIAKFKRDNSVTYTENEITVANGGKQVLYNAFMASLNPNDEVIIPAPYWVSYPDMVTIAGGNPVTVQTKEENNFLITASELEKAITENSKWLILNSPSNPTGYAYTKEHLLSLLEVVRKYKNLHIISDDIYEHLVYDNFAFSSPVTLAPDLKDRILTVNGVSKAYSMTGWRIGYAGGNAELIKAMNKVQSQSTSNACSISQAAAAAALNGNHDFLADFLKAFSSRRDYVCKEINNIPGLSVATPQGAFYAFVSIKGIVNKKAQDGTLINNCSDFAKYLLDNKLIAIVPGIGFGMENYFRMSYATSDENLQIACAKIKEACKEIS